MKLRSIKIDTKMVPEWNGNKDLPVDEQVVIHFARIPGTSEKSNYIENSFTLKGGVTISYNNMTMLGALVKKVENLDIDGPIKNGVDLANVNHPAISELIDEIRDYVFPIDEDISQGESKA